MVSPSGLMFVTYNYQGSSSSYPINNSLAIEEVHNIAAYHFNISGFHIVVLFNLSEEKVHIPSNTTKYLVVLDGICSFSSHCISCF
jgi:hypothetical protein